MQLLATQLTRSLLALGALVALGVAGYMLIEGWSFLDAAYMTIITFTTVGYEEVRPLSQTGRIFNMFVMVGGVGVMLYILTSVVHMVVAQQALRHLVRRRRMRTRISRLSGHFIVCGFGRVGKAVALTLKEQSAPLVVIDKDPEVLTEAEQHGLLCLHGDPTRDEDLLTARVDEALGLVAATGNDSDNIYISLTAPRPQPKSPNHSAGLTRRRRGQAAPGRGGRGDLPARHRWKTHGAHGGRVGPTVIGRHSC